MKLNFCARKIKKLFFMISTHPVYVKIFKWKIQKQITHKW